MFREILASRAILIGIVFFVVVVGSSLLYSWHVRRTIATELARTDPAMPQLENEKHTAQDAGVSTETEVFETSQTHLPNDDTQRMSEEAKALPRGEVSDSRDVVEAFFPDETMGEETLEDVPVSPFGFGPYPEVPEEWPASDVIWPCISANHELMTRVEIKLWKQGVKTYGSLMENGRVYPNIPGTVYIQWGEHEGPDGPVSFLARTAGEDRERLRAIADAKRKHESFTEADFPSDLKVLTFQEAGIDPYQFLELP